MHACVRYFNYVVSFNLPQSPWCENIIHNFHPDYQRAQLLNGTQVCITPHIMPHFLFFPLYDKSAKLWRKKTFSFAIISAIYCCIINCSHLVTWKKNPHFISLTNFVDQGFEYGSDFFGSAISGASAKSWMARDELNVGKQNNLEASSLTYLASGLRWLKGWAQNGCPRVSEHGLSL